MDEGIRGSMAALTASSPGVAAGQARFGTPFRLSLLGPGTLQSPERERDEGPSGGRAPGVLALTAPFLQPRCRTAVVSYPTCICPQEGPLVGSGIYPEGDTAGNGRAIWSGRGPGAGRRPGPPEIVRRHVRPAGGCAMMETRPGSPRRSGPRQRSPGPRRRDGKEGGRKESLRRRCGRAHRAILSGPPKSTARAPSPGPHVCGWCTGDVEMAPRSMLGRLYQHERRGRMPGWQCRIPDSQYPCVVVLASRLQRASASTQVRRRPCGASGWLGGECRVSWSK